MIRKFLPLLGLAILAAGCHTDMWVQPKIRPLQESTFYKDGATSRPLPPGTVAQGKARLDDARFKGRVNGQFVDELPATLEVLERGSVDTKKDLREVLVWGQERFNIYCSHCHGKAGDGKGMITQRGLVLRRKPASYHTDRLRKMPLGYFYDVISNGHGTMYSQAGRVPTDDRWAITAYVRALQKSWNVPMGEAKSMQEQDAAKATTPEAK